DALMTAGKKKAHEPELNVGDLFRTALNQIENRTARVGIIGLGYVGLPLARAFAARGFPVLGLDIDTAKITQLQAGKSYIGHIPPEVVREMRGQGVEATGQFNTPREAAGV